MTSCVNWGFVPPSRLFSPNHWESDFHLGISDARQSTRHTHVNLCVNVIVTHAVWMRRSSLVAVPSAYLVNVLVKLVVVGQ